MATKNTYTQKQFYEEVIEAMADNENAVAMAQKKLEQLANKSASSSSKKNDEHEAFFEVIRDVLAESANPMTCGAILKDERVVGFAWKDGNASSSQRVAAMLKKLVDKGDVVKTTEKKVSYFALA